MPTKSRSFEARAQSPERLVPQVVAKAPRLDERELGLVFCTEEAASAGRELAVALGARSAGTWVVLAGRAVSSERGEIEGEVGATGISLGATRGRVLVREQADPDFGAELGRALRQSRGSSAFVAIQADQLEEDWMTALMETSSAEEVARVFGGAACPEAYLHVAEGSKVKSAKAVAMVFDRSRPMQLAASAACRLISPVQRVTAAEGTMLLTLDEVPALTALGDAAHELQDQSPILLAQAEARGAVPREGRTLALKALSGIDPTRGALVLSSELPLGARVAFAVRDGRAGKQDFEVHLRALSQGARGAAPEFGILVSCAGRGGDLLGPKSTDGRMVRARFVDLPYAGFSSYFELGAIDGRLTSQIYTGLFALYSQPS